ncbi:hypothetical protein PVAG01_05078 [Phlyctema vagabunda]|uniref:Uncharacterized protein n=1 Tax=Phlyctema vagabunda TaxID=108571 RepID=A0ABR4PJ11_9HELO
MCVKTVEVYADCGCLKVSNSICYEHIEHTHMQIDDKPCPKLKFKLGSYIERAPVGTRNHRGPCPREYNSYTFQSERYAEREREKEKEKLRLSAVKKSRKVPSPDMKSQAHELDQTPESNASNIKTEDQDMDPDNLFTLPDDSRSSKRPKFLNSQGLIDDVATPPLQGNTEKDIEMVKREDDARNYWKRYKY